MYGSDVMIIKLDRNLNTGTVTKEDRKNILKWLFTETVHESILKE